MSDVSTPKLPKNKFKNQSDDPKSRYEQAVDDFKAILLDKTHAANRTKSYDLNLVSVLNRLLVAANALEEINSGEGIYGLIILALRSNLALKDKIIELQAENRELDRKVKKLEKRED